jgi:hypothetical protein
MAQWLKGCDVQTVILQATGVNWIALFQILESYRFQVNVVNARHTKTSPGRKTDVLECQWLQKLPSFGLWNNAFRPTEEIQVLRTYLRLRKNLVAAVVHAFQHMQKTLTQMNLKTMISNRSQYKPPMPPAPLTKAGAALQSQRPSVPYYRSRPNKDRGPASADQYFRRAFSEVDMSRWKTDKQFASWLGL